MIAVGQIWESRRRGNQHRILWVSNCGTRLRAIRVGGPVGRYLTAATLLRYYRLAVSA